MGHVHLFEGFLKHYGQRISMDEFKALKPGQKVKYIGSEFEVIEPGDVLVLVDEEGNKITVNYNMFIQRGAITNGE
jgi:hypothetical protein